MQMQLPVEDDVNEGQLRLEEFDDPYYGTDSYSVPFAFRRSDEE